MNAEGSDQVAIHWFRRDLRLADNPALAAAAENGTVVPVFVLDPETEALGSASRWRLGTGTRAPCGQPRESREPARSPPRPSRGSAAGPCARDRRHRLALAAAARACLAGTGPQGCERPRWHDGPCHAARRAPSARAGRCPHQGGRPVQGLHAVLERHRSAGNRGAAPEPPACAARGRGRLPTSLPTGSYTGACSAEPQ